MYSFYEKSLFGNFRDGVLDVSCNGSDLVTNKEIGLMLASAYDALGHREKAISALHRARMRSTIKDAEVYLALAKLLFRDNNKSEAENVLCEFLDHLITGEDDSIESSVNNYDDEDIADAFYILGWISIHADDHTKAYQIWSKGYRFVPTDQRLARQHSKVQCWKDISIKSDSLVALNSSISNSNIDLKKLIGGSVHFGRPFCSEDFDAFRIANCIHEPALNLFNADSQDRKLVFRSRNQILTVDECAAVVALTEHHVAENGGWTSVRSASLPTTDVAVEDVPALRLWLRCLLANVLQPMVAECFPRLVDGSTFGLQGERLRVHDAFIVRYDADKDLSTYLPEHR